MQFIVSVNQSRALEWGLNAQQAILFAFLYECPSWAQHFEHDGETMFFISKAKVIEELPLLTDRPDTVYRLMCQLRDAGLIRLASAKNRTLVALTEKGRTWNNAAPPARKDRKKIRTSKPARRPGGSEKNPGRCGKISEPGSDKSPTDHYTSDQVTRISSRGGGEPPDRPTIWDRFIALTQDRKTRSLLGRLIKDYGEPAVADAITVTEQKRPADPISYVRGVLKEGGYDTPSERRRRRDEVVAAINDTGYDWLDGEEGADVGSEAVHR